MPALSNRWNISDIHRTIIVILLLGDSTFDIDTTLGGEEVIYHPRAVVNYYILQEPVWLEVPSLLLSPGDSFTSKPSLTGGG
jgi:hypothetical protein